MKSAPPPKQFLALLSYDLARVADDFGRMPPSMTPELERALTEAFAFGAREHRAPSSVDLLEILVSNPKVASVLRECGVDTDELTSRLATWPFVVYVLRIIRFVVNSITFSKPSAGWSPCLYDCCFQAGRNAIASERPYFGLAHVLIQMFDRPTLARDVLKSANVEQISLRRYVSHGMSVYDRSSDEAVGPEDGLVKLVMHNDDYTSMDFVTEVLRDVLRDSDPEGSMMKVHNEGRMAFGPYPKKTCLAHIVEINRRAVTLGYPLRTTVERVAQSA